MPLILRTDSSLGGSTATIIVIIMIITINITTGYQCSHGIVFSARVTRSLLKLWGSVKGSRLGLALQEQMSQTMKPSTPENLNTSSPKTLSQRPQILPEKLWESKPGRHFVRDAPTRLLVGLLKKSVLAFWF